MATADRAVGEAALDSIGLGSGRNYERAWVLLEKDGGLSEMSLIGAAR